VKQWRIVLAVVGVLVALYGILRLVLSLPSGMLLLLGAWLVAAVLIHHLLWSPAVLAVGWGLRRLVPDRARTFVQSALIMAAAVTVIALPLIHRQFSQPATKAMLLQHYGLNLAWVLAGIVAGTLTAYAVRVARGRQPGRRRTSRLR
jgi:hypothetical protein